jgi:AbrB family looped-hinge helix DNA binding protein
LRLSEKTKEVRKMVKKTKDETCFLPHGKGMGLCKVEAIINIDDRGQMVLPKEIREKAGIKTGDKLAVLNWEKEGKVCCISLLRVEDFAGMVKDHLGPMLKEIVSE